LEEKANGKPNAIDILRPLQLRYFSPRELLRIFAIDGEREFVWPADVSMKAQYRLIGNSVNVRVVTELINFLYH
jgi:tRNA (cytosine38-C5)-methyltransferase